MDEQDDHEAELVRECIKRHPEAFATIRKKVDWSVDATIALLVDEIAKAAFSALHIIGSKFRGKYLSPSADIENYEMITLAMAATAAGEIARLSNAISEEELLTAEQRNNLDHAAGCELHQSRQVSKLLSEEAKLKAELAFRQLNIAILELVADGLPDEYIASTLGVTLRRIEMARESCAENE